MRKIGLGSMVLSAVIALSACQMVDTAQIKHVPLSQDDPKNAFIYCSGTAHCEFERLNAIQIMDSEQGKVYRQAVKANILRLQDSKTDANSPLYLSVRPGQHEVVIRFYPVSKNKAEKLHLIHRFNSKISYTLHMYRQRSSGSGSLLNTSAPDPLCVDLKQAKKTIRRFCKPYNALTGLGEFVEQKL